MRRGGEGGSSSFALKKKVGTYTQPSPKWIPIVARCWMRNLLLRGMGCPQTLPHDFVTIFST